MMAEETALPGSAYVQLVGGVAYLQPDEQVWEAMRRGFAIQQQSRFLAPVTVKQRDSQLRRFADWTNEYRGCGAHRTSRSGRRRLPGSATSPSPRFGGST